MYTVIRLSHLLSCAEPPLLLQQAPQRLLFVFCFFLVIGSNMTMEIVNESSNDLNSGSELRKSRGVASPEISVNAGKLTGKGDGKRMSDRRVSEKTKVCEEVETDQESGGSEEEFESPKSVVAKVRRWSGKNMVGCVHSQVLKIREEDSHLGEDIGEGLNVKDKLCSDHHHVDSRMDDVMVSSKPILPSSPLSGKTAIKI